jgi:hypothetical protein
MVENLCLAKMDASSISTPNTHFLLHELVKVIHLFVYYLYHPSNKHSLKSCKVQTLLWELSIAYLPYEDAHS